MTLVTVEVSCSTGPHRRLGVLDGDTIIDVPATHRELLDRNDYDGIEVPGEPPTSMLAMVRGGKR